MSMDLYEADQFNLNALESYEDLFSNLSGQEAGDSSETQH